MSEGRKRGREALIEKFQTLCRERLERLNTGFLALESNPDDNAAVSLIMREIHTLKGEAKLMGFADINMVAHRTEDLLIRAKEKQFRISEDFADFILRGFDVVGHLLRKAAGSAQYPLVDLQSFATEVDRLLTETELAPPPSEPAPSEPSGSATPAPEVRAATPAGERPRPKSVPPESRPPPLLELRGETSVRIDVHQLEQLTGFVGDLLQYQAQAEQSFLRLRELAENWRRELQTAQARRAIAPAQSRQTTASETHDLQWINRIEELSNQLSRVVTRGGDDVFEAGESLNQLEHTVRDLRLVPLQTLFVRYPRAIRDLAKEQGKRVTVTVRGGDLRLDKYVLDQIGEPLLHLIRNSVDHGLELPEERQAAGKAEDGLIRLSAEPAGTHVRVAVSDDGRGLSSELIRKAALSRGLLSHAEAADLSEEEWLQLIFKPGLSTREQVTDVSGRGIGLDVVKANIEGLGGSVRVESFPGQGSRFILSVPISAALMRAVLVDVEGNRFAIPSPAITAIADVRDRDLIAAGTGTAFRMQEELVPISDLAALLGYSSGSATNGGARRVAVVQGEGRLLGLRVSRVVDEREILQRPLDSFLEGTRMIIGSTVLDEREPVMVLNVPELIRRAGASAILEPATRPVQSMQATGHRVLLVDDSELLRQMLVGIVRGLGHQVIEADNGRNALTRIERQLPDLVVTDLEMPVMDGFELIQKIRATPGLKDVPIIVLSGLGSEDDKRRAAELGADAYLVKSEFSEETLTNTVHRFLKAPGQGR